MPLPQVRILKCGCRC